MIALALAAPVALAGPAFFSVLRVCDRRAFAPLVRGSIERCCILAAAGLAAAAVAAEVGVVAGVLADGTEVYEAIACPAFFLFGPPSIATAAWAAGELLSGSSLRRELAFAGAAVAAYAAGVLGYGAAMNLAPVGAALACGAAAATFSSAAAYLALRGAATPAR